MAVVPTYRGDATRSEQWNFVWHHHGMRYMTITIPARRIKQERAQHQGALQAACDAFVVAVSGDDRLEMPDGMEIIVISPSFEAAGYYTVESVVTTVRVVQARFTLQI